MTQINVAGMASRLARRRSKVSFITSMLLCILLCGCFSFGPDRLDQDQINYSRALSSSEKRETLLDVVRLRYADSPSFLEATQVISGYQLQRNVNAGFQFFPGLSPSSLLSGGGTAQLQQSPTFTFQPVTGEQFAQSFVRPLSPAELLPFALGGLPVDVLFRLGVQSVNRLENAVPLTERGSSGSPEFFRLIYDLRVLQIAGLVGVGLERDKDTGVAGSAAEHGSRVAGRVYLSFSASSEPRYAAALSEAKQLLGLAPGAEDAEVVYGRLPRAPGQVAVLTRSMLGVLSQLAFDIEVPQADVDLGRTPRTGGPSGVERRPVVVVHSGKVVPLEPFVAIEYQHSWFWIAEEDFDSKLAFSIVEILLALAKTVNPPGTIVTIPAG